MGQVRRPEGDRAVLVAQVYYGVVGVLAHSVACTELCAVLDDQLAGGCVLVLEVPGIALMSVRRA